jgi:hypothetical protein
MAVAMELARSSQVQLPREHHQTRRESGVVLTNLKTNLTLQEAVLSTRQVRSTGHKADNLGSAITYTHPEHEVAHTSTLPTH